MNGTRRGLEHMITKTFRRALTGALSLSVLLGTTALSAQDYPIAPDRAATETILLDHIKVLASDEYGGRLPGTEGGQKTQAYMIEKLESYGYQPGYKGEWRQQVMLEGQVPGALVLTIGDTEIAGDDAFALSLSDSPLMASGAELVALGSPEDIAATQGKVAVITNPMAAQSLLGPAMEGGALGALVLVEQEPIWNQFRAFASRPQWNLAGDDMEEEDEQPLVALVGPTTSAAILAALGTDSAALGERSGEVIGTSTFSSDAESLTAESANVVGMLPGTKPGSGAIIMMGHWDHLGSDCAPETEEDRICNGAADNASGIAAILETSRRLAMGPRLERDIYIMGTTAEEMGLLGARYFADNPPIPLEDFQAALNIDMISIAPAGTPLTVIGWGDTPMDAPIKLAAAALNRTIDVGEESAKYVRRQDGWALMNKGVPAVLVSGAFADDDILNEFMGTRYHKPSDQVHDELEISGMAEDVPLYVVLMAMLANPDRYEKPQGWEFDRGE